MTRDDIIKLALEAEATEIGHKPPAFHFYLSNLERFAALVAAAERREWVGLEQSDMPDGEDPIYDDPRFIAGMVWAANTLMKKNTFDLEE